MINNLNFTDTLKIGTVHSLYSGYIKNAAKKFMPLRPNTSIEIIDYLREGFGYAFVLKSLVSDSINNGNLKDVKIKNIHPHILESYVVINKDKIKKESVDCFIKLM
jgi:hypothetical protein